MTTNEILKQISNSRNAMEIIYDWVRNNEINLEQFYMAIAYQIALLKNEINS